eukprot:scaffold1401_cov330-Pavlova_lutheri.AAC.56
MESISQEKISHAMNAYLYLTFMSSESFCGCTRYLRTHGVAWRSASSVSGASSFPGFARVIGSEPLVRSSRT